MTLRATPGRLLRKGSAGVGAYMKGLKFAVTKNALANLVRGGATAAVAIVLPHFLTRSLDTEHFSAWSLILQISAYASYLDFGLQTAVARFIAQAVELEQEERQAKLVSTALLLLSLAAVLVFALISVVICFFPDLFHGVPRGLLPDFRKAALVLSLSASIMLPLSTYTGVLIGIRRNEIPALAIGGSRIAGAAAVIVAAHATHSLTVLALCVAMPNLLGGLLQMAAVRGLIAAGRARLRHVSRAIGGELLRFCTGLAMWSFGMLAISGLDVTIVGHFRFEAVGYYSLAAMLIGFFSGLTNSALSALMAPVSALHARGNRVRIVGIILTATRMTVIVNLSLTAVIFFAGDALLTAWVGPVYAANAVPILRILAVAQTLRLTFAPYSVMLIGIGEQNKSISSAMCEAVVNLCASILGMILLGPIGVAWGTLAGACCAVLWVLFRTMPSVAEVRMTLKEFVAHAVLPGSIPFMPLVILWFFRGYAGPRSFGTGLGVCGLAAALLAGRVIKESFGQRAL